MSSGRYEMPSYGLGVAGSVRGHLLVERSMLAYLQEVHCANRCRSEVRSGSVGRGLPCGFSSPERRVPTDHQR